MDIDQLIDLVDQIKDFKKGIDDVTAEISNQDMERLRAISNISRLNITLAGQQSELTKLLGQLKAVLS